MATLQGYGVIPHICANSTEFQLNFIKYNDLHMNCAKQTLSKPYIKVVLILSCVDLDYTEFMIDSTQKCKLMTILLI